MSIESVMPSNHLCHLSPPAINLSQHQDLFQWVSSSHQVAKYGSFHTSPSNEYSGLISFRIDWLVWSPCSPRDSQESSPEQYFKSINLWHLAFLMVQLSHPYMATSSITSWQIEGEKVEAVGSCKHHLTISAMICDRRDKLLPTREIHLSLDVQGFYWCSIT